TFISLCRPNYPRPEKQQHIDDKPLVRFSLSKRLYPPLIHLHQVSFNVVLHLRVAIPPEEAEEKARRMRFAWHPHVACNTVFGMARQSSSRIFLAYSIAFFPMAVISKYR